MVVVLAARMRPLEPCQPVPYRHALDQTVVDQQVEHPVDAGAAGGLSRIAERVLDLSALVAVVAMWGGLALSYEIASLPPSSAIIGLAGAAYAGATLVSRVRTAV